MTSLWLILEALGLWFMLSFAIYGLLRFGSENRNGCGMFIAIMFGPFLIAWFTLCDIYDWIFGRTS